jgi:hypothetical protein
MFMSDETGCKYFSLHEVDGSYVLDDARDVVFMKETVIPKATGLTED